MPLLRVGARRVGQALVSLWVASVLVFVMLLAAPGDPARRVLAARGIGDPTARELATQRERLGLDEPLLPRYLGWLGDVLQGDLGSSWTSGRTVGDELGERLPATLLLTGVALGLALAAALVLGVVAAARPGRAPDAVVRAVTLLGATVPSFVVATLALEVLAVRWGWFRVVADGSVRSVWLPAATLAVGVAAVWARLLRAGILDARQAPYLDVLAARGSGPVRLLVGHAVPHALVPFATVVGLGTATLLGGAPIVESVFTWPGVGRYAVESITARDLPAIQGVTLLAVAAYVAVSLVVDLVVAAVDPRLRPD